MCTSKFPDASENAGSIPSATQHMHPLFQLGQVVATPSVLEHLERYEVNAQTFIERHQCGDWGNVPPEDAFENDFSVKRKLRILSAYDIVGERVWIITEADRSSTCLLFPHEY